ncbi:pyrimidine-specific ribonucleoside hydrolase RihA [Candidatus Falkowbacteria bacterium]|jgi:inosine-uridine nucleoside N-ribohydrolase|nr:pyrimidine-specific ribonucleoside hydrolase RihA [Candidatus Falkowbacteria bacterium]MBT5502603.1 pyrimidine-specific ribonucleoside hydrolase RihA [Candidatus Falkowbacteria bacterium]MBT6574588.1 pyrimidine-specific ribonucleoside hydrolase RihA [Candidatus Falkowbacteria bacterium]MBT7348999.1 pyrimidine-specific ribonucleoside hydrolase RihA [Candidatus Falkowbacteria bacterium]MBT7500341.1 pyrimidine-specific ribonucleoside hydrolase RihA [Candidatus Falkowbacteria bacterium]
MIKQLENDSKPLLIIDTDPGHDDAMAIMLIEKSKLFDIKALTTVAGNTDIQKTTNNARYILDLLESDVPIYSGAEKPLKRELIKAQVHGESGLAGANVIKEEKLNNLAVDKIIEIVKANPGQVSILTIGPETNLAQAILREPQLPELIKQIVIMGGAIEVPGNKNRVAEFNVFVDPDAAKIVFDCSTPKVLLPLDICNEVFMTLSDFERLEGIKLYEPIMSMMKHFIKGIAEFEKNTKGALVYDALAAYYLIKPEAFKLQLMDVRVETKGEVTLGMTAADRRSWGEQKPNIKVATFLDRQEFIDDFVRILKQ